MASRFGNWIRWQRVPVAELGIRRPAFEATWFTLYAVGYVLLSMATGLLILRWPAPLFGATSLTNDAWYVLLFKAVGLLIVPLVGLRALGYRFDHLLPRMRWSAASIVVLVLVFAAGFFLNTQHFERIAARAPAFGEAELVGRVLLGALLALVTAGIPEEVAYRGLLQTRLEAVWGRVPALLLTALLFTAWHLPTRYLLSHGVEGAAGDLASVLVGTGVPVFIVGLIFGWAWDRYRSLPHLIAVHWAIDILPNVSSFLGFSF